MKRIIVKRLPDEPSDILSWLTKHNLFIEVLEDKHGWAARFVTDADSTRYARPVGGYPNTIKHTAEEAVSSLLVSVQGAKIEVPGADTVPVPRKFSGFEAFLTELASP